MALLPQTDAKVISIMQLAPKTPDEFDWMLVQSEGGISRRVNTTLITESVTSDLDELVERAETAAAVATNKIPSLTLGQIKALEDPLFSGIYLHDRVKFGYFSLDNTTTLTPDDVICIQDLSGNKWVRDIPGAINAAWYNVLTTNTDNSSQLRTAILKAHLLNRELVIFPGTYQLTSAVDITNTDLPNQNGVSIRGLGSSYRETKFEFSGTGYALSIIGNGDEGTNPITRFKFQNFWISGENNLISSGGFYFERCYIVKLIDCASTSWAGTTAHAGEFRNMFNFRLQGGNYSNGFPLPAGGSVIVVGSKNANPYNMSNIQIVDTLIQRGLGQGLEVQHDNNIMDNLLIDNVSFGGNQGGSFKCFNSNVNNISINNSHFESAGYNMTSTPIDAIHIDIDSSSCVFINNCEFKDAKTHIKLHRVNSFKINPCKIYETGNYTIAASTGISITGTSSNYSLGSIEFQNIFSNQIDTPIVRDQYSRISWPMDSVTEAQFTAKYASNPFLYEGVFVRRKEIKAGNVDAAFQQAWTSTGTDWYRVATLERGLGSAAAMPTTGSFTQGDSVRNRNPTLAGVAGFRYTVAGWNRITSGTNHVLGTDWVEMREYYELTFFTASTAFDPPSIAANSQVTTTVTVTGAAVGMMALATFTVSAADGLTDNVELRAKVTSANTVTCIFKNLTGSAIDLGSGAIAVRVL